MFLPCPSDFMLPPLLLRQDPCLDQPGSQPQILLSSPPSDVDSFYFILFYFILFYFILFFPFCPPPPPPPPLWHTELLGQGSDLSHIVTYAEVRATRNPLTHCAGPGIDPTSWHCRDAADPIAPRGNSWPLSCPLSSLCCHVQGISRAKVTFLLVD